jgi:hypothetical protein
MFMMRFAIAATVKIMYAPLVIQLQLSRKQADTFYRILVDAGIKNAKLMRAGKLGPNDAKSLETDLQSLLGDAGFAQYQDYVQNDMNDHVFLRQIRRDLASHPLSDTQLLQLWQAMKTARQTATANHPLDLSQANLSERTATVVQYMDEQQQQNFQNVLQQAAAFLSPEQLQTLGTSQSDFLEKSKAGVAFAQKMFTNAPAISWPQAQRPSTSSARAMTIEELKMSWEETGFVLPRFFRVLNYPIWKPKGKEPAFGVALALILINSMFLLGKTWGKYAGINVLLASLATGWIAYSVRWSKERRCRRGELMRAMIFFALSCALGAGVGAAVVAVSNL